MNLIGMPEPIDQKPVINSHTPTEFGVYDAEPFPVEGAAYYWYIRAVYWKREANRKEGVQTTMEFDAVSRQGSDGKITLSPADMKIVKDFMEVHWFGNSGQFSNKISAIKHVRMVTMCGLTEAKDYVEALDMSSFS